MPEKRQWLIDARIAKGLSRAQVAEAIGVHHTYIYKIEIGERDLGLDVAFLLADLLDINVKLFNKNPDKKSDKIHNHTA